MIQRDANLGTIRLGYTKFKLYLSQKIARGNPRTTPYVVRRGAGKSHGSHQAAFRGILDEFDRLYWAW